MAITSDIIKHCLTDKREEILAAQIVPRPLEIDEHLNYVFVGVRQAGKTYMLYQLVHQLLKQGVGWDELLFVNFEDERLAEVTSDDLNRFVEVHLETYGKRPYIFLDEIQNIPHWDKFARRLADAKYRIFITGSNAKMLSKDVATTLGGRFVIRDVYPFTFVEYLQARGVELAPDWQYSTEQCSIVKRNYHKYVHNGAMPAFATIDQSREALSSLYQKIYLGDIAARHGLKNERALALLIKKLADSVKNPVSYQRLRNSIVSTGTRISLPTVIDYVQYATDSWFVLPMENELASFSSRESQKKYYFIDCGLLNLFLINPETSLLENLVAIELMRRYGKSQVRFYRNSHEIDFVVPDSQLAVQVSYSLHDSETQEREIKPLLHFGNTHPGWQLLVITHEDERQLDNGTCHIQVLPAWKWLLM